jgi:phosphoribosylanthranilate isomerase
MTDPSNAAGHHRPLFRVKICGITTAQDAARAVDCGADAIGLNFYLRSLRHVTVSTARQIAEAIPARIVKVGVFVNASADEMLGIAREVGLNAIQLHGEEVVSVAAAIGDWPLVRAVRVDAARAAAAVAEIDRWISGAANLSALLIDAFDRAQYGGTGRLVDRKLAGALRDAAGKIPLVLAGGLDSDNVAAAIAEFQPAAVDVASGVEQFPGHKDPALLARFIERARAALEALE